MSVVASVQPSVQSAVQPALGVGGAGDNRRAQANVDAAAAVALIPTTTQYQKDQIYQFVYNQSFLGNWALVGQCIVPFLGNGTLSNGLVDLKGGTDATVSGTASYAVEDGVNKGIEISDSGVSYINTNVSILDAVYGGVDTNSRDYIITSYINEWTSPTSGQGFIYGAYQPGTNWTWISSASLSDPTIANGTAGTTVVYGTKDSYIGFVLGQTGTAANTRLYIDGTLVLDSPLAQNDSYVPPTLPIVLNNATTNTGVQGPTGNLTQWGFYAISKGEEEGFNWQSWQADVNKLMIALERNEQPFDYVVAVGDSLFDVAFDKQDDIDYLQASVVQRTKSPLVLENYAITGKKTDEIEFSLECIFGAGGSFGDGQGRLFTFAGNNAEGYTAVMIDGGLNDLNQLVSVATAKQNITDSFTILRNSGIWDVFYHQCTATKESSLDAVDPADIAEINTHIDAEIAAHNAASPFKGNFALTDPDIYNDMLTDDPNYPNALARRETINLLTGNPWPNQVIFSEQTLDYDFTIYGVHYTTEGAYFIAGRIDSIVRSTRYSQPADVNHLVPEVVVAGLNPGFSSGFDEQAFD